MSSPSTRNVPPAPDSRCALHGDHCSSLSFFSSFVLVSNTVSSPCSNFHAVTDPELPKPRTSQDPSSLPSTTEASSFHGTVGLAAGCGSVTASAGSRSEPAVGGVAEPCFVPPPPLFPHAARATPSSK